MLYLRIPTANLCQCHTSSTELVSLRPLHHISNLLTTAELKRVGEKMPATGFKISWIAWREIFNFFGALDDASTDSEDEDDIDEDDDDLDVRDRMRIFIRRAIMSETEEKDIGVGNFLQRQIEMAIEDYNRASKGVLIRTLVGEESQNGKDVNVAFMDTVMEKCPNWFSFSWETPADWPYPPNEKERSHSFCRLVVNLGDFGCYGLEIQTMKLVHMKSHLSLSHFMCVKISTMLVQEYLHVNLCSYQEEYCKVLCKRIETDWRSQAVWKVNTLNIPKPLCAQLVETMKWMYMSGVMYK